MKILSIYLPQFYRTAENDEWWGEGFTDWEAVRRAKPMFDGHHQPVEPVSYYDLSQTEVLRNQAELMHKYAIDGMCFYHYYFGDRKVLLDKPSLNLLENKDIDMPFCFYWANISWIRSWSNINASGNVWTEVFEDKIEDKENNYLVKQEYGSKKEWKNHFDYLLPFFKDNRYLKKDNKPVFLIHQPTDILPLRDMVLYFNDLAIGEGFDGVFFIGNGIMLDGNITHEPDRTFSFYEKFNNDKFLQKYLSYEELWETLLENTLCDENNYLCGVSGFDDTPRRGNMGVVVHGRDANSFERYMKRLLFKAELNNSEFVFLNAWNEWGEGMYLEPDKVDGEAYLKAIYNAKNYVITNYDFLNSICRDNRTGLSESTEALQSEIKLKKYTSLYQVMKKWVQAINASMDGSPFYDEMIQGDIAVYGLGVIGNILIDGLKKFGYSVKYGIDNNKAISSNFDFPVYSLTDDFQVTDVIIVSVEYQFEDIKKRLENRGFMKIVSIEEVLIIR